MFCCYATLFSFRPLMPVMLLKKLNKATLTQQKARLCYAGLKTPQYSAEIIESTMDTSLLVEERQHLVFVFFVPPASPTSTPLGVTH